MKDALLQDQDESLLKLKKRLTDDCAIHPPTKS